MRDEGVRASVDMAKMATLPTVFKKDGGVVTAGNASQISDGAAALLLASPEACEKFALRKRARIITRVVVGSDPELMLDGPIEATSRALAKAGLKIGDIDAVEINEAFATVVLAWAQAHKADMDRVNIQGGAIAHGHPLGATGAVLMTKLVNILERTGGRYGLQTMCEGFGMANATIIECVN
jgi:acetyl-CoA acetyltransferase family protein